MTTKTELLNNGVVVATKTAAPFYSWDWTPATSGASSLTYKRYEDNVLVFTSAAITGTVEAAAAFSVLGALEPSAAWYNFTDKAVGVFTGALEANGNYTTSIASGTPEYIAGTKLKTLRSENDGIDLGNPMAFLNTGTDGFTIYMKFNPIEIGYLTYLMGATEGSNDNQLIIGLSTTGQLEVYPKFGVITLYINRTSNSIWSGAAPYETKDIFIEVIKATGEVKFYDGTTLLTKGTTGNPGDISGYSPIINWFLGGRNDGGAIDAPNDISAEFQHVIINPKLFSETDKLNIINNV